MMEAKPAYQILSRCLVVGSLVWCTSSHVLRSSTPLTCTSLFGQGIGGSLVLYRPILEGGGAEVCIYMTTMVSGMVAETSDNEVAPSLRHSDRGTDA